MCKLSPCSSRRYVDHSRTWACLICLAIFFMQKEDKQMNTKVQLEERISSSLLSAIFIKVELVFCTPQCSFLTACDLTSSFRGFFVMTKLRYLPVV